MVLIGDWSVEPERNRISRGNESRAIRPLPMDVLMHLVEREGDVVLVSELLDLCWQGRVGDDAVHRCISHLRKQLGDDHKTPVFIQTVYKRGYRLISPVTRPIETGPTTGSYDQVSEDAIDIGLPALDVRCDSLAPVAEVLWEDIVGLLSKIKIFRFNSSTPFLNNRVLRSKAVQTHDTIHLRLCIELGGQEVWSARFELNESDFQ